MKNLSLKWKIYIVGLVPFSFFLFSMLVSINENYSGYKETESLKSKMEVIEAASAVVHESQKERGKSAGFLNGGVTLASLNDQRNINDKKRSKLREIVKSSAFKQSYQNEIIEELDKYESLRNKISSKQIPLGEALKSYSGIIRRFLDIELDVANSTKLPSIAAKLKGFRILEDAKESGGKLRANMTGVLAKNKPINDEKFSAIVSLKAGVDEGIKSSGLTLDEKSTQFISQFNQSKEWSTVNGTFQLILKNSEKGNYYQDASEFFSIITGALNILGELIIHQKNELVSSVNEIQDRAVSSLWKISLTVVGLVLGLFFFVSFMSSSITKKIRSVIVSLRTNSEEVSSSSEEIANTSNQLSEASTEQASALQETVSSIDEISSMVQRNADAAGSSTATSEKSKEEASKGKQSIDEMITSIGAIAKSNQEIMDEMQNNNEQMNKITVVISEIGEKTKVINDIVFQTKLLSFNASVEAARAGEHGKGFAVVAEEVGNLAAMSGKAALEISEMLESSIKQVKDIMDSSKGKIEKLVVQGKEKVDHGTDIAHKCGEALESILSNVGSVNEMVREISTASAEQSTGVREITSAMQQLDQVTHQNTSAAQSSASMATQLKSSAQNLNKSVKELAILVDGGGAAATSQNFEKSLSNQSSQPAKVIPITSSKTTTHPLSNHMKQVSGSDVSIPSDNDPRFEDL
jgi:methyl-accepting chemotaxis protein